MFTVIQVCAKHVQTALSWKPL